MIIKSLAAMALVGALTASSRADQVTIAGQTWNQPGTATYYRWPGTPAVGPAVAAQRGAKVGASPNPTDDGGALHDAAHLLRSAAWHLDRARKKGDAGAEQAALDSLRRARALLGGGEENKCQ